MADYSGALGRAWKYSLNSRRLGVLFLFFIAASAIAAAPMLLIYKTITLGALNLITLIQFFAWFFAGLVIAMLIFLYATLMFTHNYANQKQGLEKSARFAASNYPRFLAVIIVTSVITFIVSAVPFIGFIFSIIAGLVFFFIYQEVAFGSSFSRTLKNSYRIFMDNKLDTILTFIITAVLAFLIILIFAIPFILIGIFSLVAALQTGAFMQAVMANFGAFVIAGIILLIGAAFAILFTNSAKTDIYMQLKKKRKS